MWNISRQELQEASKCRGKLGCCGLLDGGLGGV